VPAGPAAICVGDHEMTSFGGCAAFRRFAIVGGGPGGLMLARRPEPTQQKQAARSIFKAIPANARC
jgi:hypothetical protein